MIDFMKLQKTMAQMSPDQFRGMMMELLNAQPPGAQGQPPGQMAPQGVAPLPSPPADTGGEQHIIDGTVPRPQYPQPHPTQTPGAVMRQEIMRQPGLLAGRMQ